MVQSRPYKISRNRRYSSVVHVVECVKHVHGLPKFITGVLPEKSNDYHEGQQVHIPGGKIGVYQAVYIPKVDCELKAITLAWTAYNFKDSYDIIIGGQSTEGEQSNYLMPARLLVKNAPTIEMAEIEQLELYTKVQAGVPIIVKFYNNSMTEKWMFVKFITLQDTVPKVELDSFNWYYDWNGYHINMFGTQVYEEFIKIPDYYNSAPNRISHVEIIAKELVVAGRRIAKIEIGEGVLNGKSTTYIEDSDGPYAEYKSLARSGPVMIKDIQIITNSKNGNLIKIIFERIELSSDPWLSTGRINMNLSITATNKII